MAEKRFNAIFIMTGARANINLILTIFTLLLVVAIHLSFHLFAYNLGRQSGGGFYYKPEMLFGESAYSAIAKEAYEGKIPPRDAYLYEYKNSAYINDPLPPLIVAFLGRISGSFSRGVILVFMIFPALSFILARSLALKVSKSQIGSLLIAFSAIFFPSLFANFTLWTKLWETVSSGHPVFLRTFIPLLTFPFLLFFLLSHHNFFFAKRFDYKTALLLAIAASVTFYIYTFYWTFAVVAVGLTILFKIIVKDIKLRSDWISLMLFLVVFLIIIIPFVMNRYHMNEVNSDLVSRCGIHFGRYFLVKPFLKVFIVIAVLIIAFLLKFINSRELCYFVLLSLPFAILENIQLFTGFNMSPWHWEKYVQSPLQTVILLTIFIRFLKSIKAFGFLRSNTAIIITYFSIILFFGYASVLKIYIYTDSMKNEMPALNRYLPVYRYLGNHTPEDSVLMSSVENYYVYSWVPILTHNNVFLPREFNHETNERFIERYTISMKLFGANTINYSNYLESPLHAFFLAMYQCAREYTIEPPDQYPPQIREKCKKFSIANIGFFVYMPLNHRERLRLKFNGFPLKENINKFRIDYILCVGETELDTVKTNLNRLGKRYSEIRINDDLVLLKIPKP